MASSFAIWLGSSDQNVFSGATYEMVFPSSFSERLDKLPSRLEMFQMRLETSIEKTLQTLEMLHEKHLEKRSEKLFEKQVKRRLITPRSL